MAYNYMQYSTATSDETLAPVESGWDVPDFEIPGFQYLPVSETMKANQKYIGFGVGVGIVLPIVAGIVAKVALSRK